MRTDIAKLPATRAGICSLQAAILDQPDQLDGEAMVTSHFAPGIYARQMDASKGDVVVGKIHKHAHLNILTKGVAEVVSEFGRDTIRAPATWVSQPGIKRAIHVLEDIQWITIHPNVTDTRDMEEIESFVIAPSHEALDAHLLEVGV